MRHLASRSALLVLTGFLALTAISGGVLVVPGLPIEWIEGSVFSDYTIPAIALGVVGALALVAAILAFRRSAWAGLAAVVVGLAMITFEVVEIAAVGFSLTEYGLGEPFAWLQVIFIVIGVLTATAGAAVWRSHVIEAGQYTDGRAGSSGRPSQAHR